MPSIYVARATLALLQSVGMENVSAQISNLSRSFLEGARALGISAKTPADTVGPLVVLQSNDPTALVEKLAKHGVLVSARRDGVRFSFHVYNNQDDVDKALAVLARS